MDKSKIYGLIGSTLSSTILLLVLWFLVLTVPGSSENEGFQVSLGDSYDAGGMGDDAPVVSTKLVNIEQTLSNSDPKTAEVKSTDQKVFTQTETSVSITEKKEKEQKKKDAELQQIQQTEKNRKIAEQLKKEQEAKDKAKSIDGLFGNSTSGTGKGSGSGNGTGKGVGSGSGNGIQGNPAGNGNSGVGFTLNLGNRKFVGDMYKPNYPKDIEGKITVNIRVDQNGAVTSTSIGTPTTISDSEMRREAMSAANRTKFTPGKNVETGSITYNYKLQ